MMHMEVGSEIGLLAITYSPPLGVLEWRMGLYICLIFTWIAVLTHHQMHPLSRI